MRTWVCAIIINREISIRKVFSPIITIPQEDMCAVLVELISFSWHKLSEYAIIIIIIIIITKKYIKTHECGKLLYIVRRHYNNYHFPIIILL